MLRIVLSDKRTLVAPPMQPTVRGYKVGTLVAGDTLDGATVLSISPEKYEGEFTYDILPSGETGFYFADQVLIASSITKKQLE